MGTRGSRLCCQTETCPRNNRRQEPYRATCEPFDQLGLVVCLRQQNRALIVGEEPCRLLVQRRLRQLPLTGCFLERRLEIAGHPAVDLLQLLSDRRIQRAHLQREVPERAAPDLTVHPSALLILSRHTEQALDSLGRRNVVLEGGLQHLTLVPLPLSINSGQCQVALRREEIVKASLLRARMLADFGDAHAVVAACVEQLHRARYEALSRVRCASHGLVDSAHPS